MNLKTRQLIVGLLLLALAMAPKYNTGLQGLWAIIYLIVVLISSIITGVYGGLLILSSLQEEECECDDMSEEEFFDHMNEIENDESNNSRQ